MTEKKAPVIIGPQVDPTTDPVLSRYKGGVAARAEAARQNKPKIGNLAQANEAFKPGRDGPMTIGQITEAQRKVDSENTGGLSAQSIAGMRAVAEATAASRAQKAAQQSPQPQQPKEKKMSENKPETSPDAKARERIANEVDNLDDFEIERIMRGIQSDVINNAKERDHVNNPENKRLSEIDFAAGIAEGEFTQIVDVIVKSERHPGLRVHYRTMTPMENQAIRLWIFKRVSEDPRLERISGEMFGLGMVVATTVQVGTKKFPDHLKRQGQGTYNAEFDEEAFAMKYNEFARMPQPLIHAIGVHGQWFDVRVRQLFTADYAKNG